MLHPIESLESRRMLNAGDLDTTFGTNGVTAETFSQTFLSFKAVAVQNDGKIVAVGATNDEEGFTPESKVVIARFKTDGTLDTTFSNDGFTLTNLNAGCLGANAVAIQQDNKILVSGAGSGFGFVARLKTDGTLDSIFGTGGVAKTADLQSDVLALSSTGLIYTAGGPQPIVARFTSAGKPDSSFGTNGIFSFFTAGTNIDLRSIAVQSDGKPVVVGDSVKETEGQIPPSKTFVARLTTAGKFDKTFATTGSTAIAIDNTVDGTIGQNVAILSGGKILVSSNGNSNAWLSRINSDGSIDSTFGSTGSIRLVPFTTDPAVTTTFVFSLAVQGDGKIVAGGYVDTPSSRSMGLERLNADGTADTTFSVDGRTVNSVSLSANAIAINSTNQIIVVGDISTGPSALEATIAAFHETGGESSPVVRSDQGELSVTGTAGNDTVTIATNGTHLVATFNGVATSFTAKTVKSITARGLAGVDDIRVSANITGSISGGDGNDIIIGSDVAQTLDGGDGNDHIFAGDGPAVILGGDGNDHLFGSAARDSIRGGLGKDTLHGGGGIDTLHGDSGSDHIYGDDGKDRLFGEAGNDHILARDQQPDILSGGSGTDTAQIDPSDQKSSIEKLLA